MIKKYKTSFVEFSNEAIKNFKPDYAIVKADGSVGWAKQKYTPFKVAKDSVLKGLYHYQVRGSDVVSFVLTTTINSNRIRWTIGRFTESFGTKECEEKIYKYARGNKEENIPEHTDSKGSWLHDPRLTEKNLDKIISNLHVERLQNKTLNDVIIEYIKDGYPKQFKSGYLNPISIKRFNWGMIGGNQREKHIKIIHKNDRSEIIFKANKKTRVKAPVDWDELFNKYPPGKYCIKKGPLNPSGHVCFYDSWLGKRFINEITQVELKTYFKDRSRGIQKFFVRLFRSLWAFSKENNYLGDNLKDPTKDISIKKQTKNNAFSKYNKLIFSDDQLSLIAETFNKIRPEFPFQTECLELQMYTSIREEEARKIKQVDVKIKEGIIELPGSITKTGEPRKLIITEPVAKLLNHLEQLKTTPGYEWYNFVPWLFATPRFKFEDYKKLKLTPDYINSDETQLKGTRGAWLRVRELTGILGAPKSFRKTYATKAKQIVGGDLGIKLTGHQLTSTLDTYYYGEDIDQIKKDAAKVAQVYSFKRKAE